MGSQQTVVDSSSPAAIAQSIKTVNQTPGLRIKTGAQALWKIYNAPGHSLTRAALEKDFGALDLHFGWFCRRVAEELGSNEPDAFSLVDYSGDGESQILTLKPAVVAAMAKAKKFTKSAK